VLAAATGKGSLRATLAVILVSLRAAKCTMSPRKFGSVHGAVHPPTSYKSLQHLSHSYPTHFSLLRLVCLTCTRSHYYLVRSCPLALPYLILTRRQDFANMPARTASAPSTSVIMQHDSANDFLAVAYPTLRRHEASSNIVLAHALKRVGTEAALSGNQFTSDADVDAWLASADTSSFTPHRANGAFWLTLWSSTTSAPPTLDIILACVDWTLGDYPIFLWTPKAPSEHSSAWLAPRIGQLVEHLRYCVPPERIFSVFGMTSLVKTFARHWSHLTGFRIEPEPFYAAFFSFCNTTTFRNSTTVLPTGHCLRRATPGDLEQVAQLCKEFADDSVRI
jgi:hypothetical protein